MSIITKHGDQGTTALMYNRRVPKSHPRVEAYGAVDELSAALGIVRATTPHASMRARLERIQKDLVVLMGELATLSQDRQRYVTDGYPLVTQEFIAGIEEWAREVERRQPRFAGWAMPGASTTSAQLDFARTVCRRAERHLCGLQGAGELPSAELLIYLNRLSDLLWLLARAEEHPLKASPRRPGRRKH